jgi:hypothetical protein
VVAADALAAACFACASLAAAASLACCTLALSALFLLIASIPR